MLAGPEAGHLVYTPNRQFNYVKIKIEKEDSEDNRLNTFNSEATVGKLGTLKLRLVIKTLLNIKHYTILSIIISKILQQATERAFIQR